MLILATLLLSGAVQAEPAPAPAPKPEKKSCRTFGTTGTIMGGKRICHTRAEWSQIDGDSQGRNDHVHDQMNNAARSSY
jgi:hypothetical protein